MDIMALKMQLAELEMQEKAEREKRKQATIDRVAKNQIERIKEREKRKNEEIKIIKQKIKEENKSPLAKVGMSVGGLSTKKYANPVTFVDNLKKRK
jgi:hypothetical protein